MNKAGVKGKIMFGSEEKRNQVSVTSLNFIKLRFSKAHTENKIYFLFPKKKVKMTWRKKKTHKLRKSEEYSIRDCLLLTEEMFYFDRPDLVILGQFESEHLCPHENLCNACCLGGDFHCCPPAEKINSHQLCCF